MDTETQHKYLTYKGDESVAIIELTERVLGGSDALEFTERLDDYVKGDFSVVLVDLKNVELMNSSGLGMLVGGLKTLRGRDIPMGLVNPPEKVVKLLKMTHLDSVFNKFDSIESAIKELK